MRRSRSVTRRVQEPAKPVSKASPSRSPPRTRSKVTKSPKRSPAASLGSKKPQTKNDVAKFSVGDSVMAIWPGTGLYYRAKVSYVRASDNQYDVEFENGTIFTLSAGHVKTVAAIVVSETPASRSNKVSRRRLSTSRSSRSSSVGRKSTQRVSNATPTRQSARLRSAVDAVDGSCDGAKLPVARTVEGINRFFPWKAWSRYVPPLCTLLCCLVGPGSLLYLFVNCCGGGRGVPTFQLPHSLDGWQRSLIGQGGLFSRLWPWLFATATDWTSILVVTLVGSALDIGSIVLPCIHIPCFNSITTIGRTRSKSTTLSSDVLTTPAGIAVKMNGLTMSLFVVVPVAIVLLSHWTFVSIRLPAFWIKFVAGYVEPYVVKAAAFIVARSANLMAVSFFLSVFGALLLHVLANVCQGKFVNKSVRPSTNVHAKSAKDGHILAFVSGDLCYPSFLAKLDVRVQLRRFALIWLVMSNLSWLVCIGTNVDGLGVDGGLVANRAIVSICIFQLLFALDLLSNESKAVQLGTCCSAGLGLQSMWCYCLLAFLPTMGHHFLAGRSKSAIAISFPALMSTVSLNLFLQYVYRRSENIRYAVSQNSEGIVRVGSRSACVPYASWFRLVRYPDWAAETLIQWTWVLPAVLAPGFSWYNHYLVLVLPLATTFCLFGRVAKANASWKSKLSSSVWNDYVQKVKYNVFPFLY